MTSQRFSAESWIGAVLPWILLCAGLASASAVMPRGFMGIGLDDSETAIATQFANSPGIVSRDRRVYRDGSVEQQFTLRDGAFVRVVFPGENPDEVPKFLSFDGGAALSGPDAAKEIVRRFGRPTWEQHVDHGATVRRVWGGTGTPGAGVVPKPDAAEVVDFVASDGRSATLTIARPSWFQSGEKR